MYPYPIIWNIDLYTIFIAIGIVFCFVLFRIVSDKINMNAKIFNFALLCGGIAIISGLFSSIVFQAFFNLSTTGKFTIDENTGSTFAGGLLGGAAAFILVYFIFGNKVFKGYKAEFRKILLAGSCAIPLAHAFGRIGCLMAGCCYGNPTDSFIGIHMVSTGYKVVPVQLFESLFLFALSAFLTYWTIKKHKNSMSLYMIGYGVWRIFIEFFRGDDRGTAITKILTPAQEICSLLIIGGLVLYFLYEKKASAANE